MKKSQEKVKNVTKVKGKANKSVVEKNVLPPASKDGKQPYFCSMSCSPSIDQESHWFQQLPIIFFTAIVIVLVRMVPYERDMSQFYWHVGGNNLTDFFSYIKMLAILAIAGTAILILLYRVFIQSFYIKRTWLYIPMLVYILAVLIAYFSSDFKEFALLGWNDRFEGTMAIIAYMIMLFYIINTVNTEKGVSTAICAVAVSTVILGALGISQALDKDFFRTVIGQKLITPNVMTDSGLTLWELVDQAAEKGEQALNFTFLNREIYQTVYNINYVSFYLTLLLPLFGLLFIRSFLLKNEEPLYRKVAWASLFALALYNLIGSASSGGFLGMGIVVITAFLLLNKRIIRWWKPLIILLVITTLVGGITYERWSSELIGAAKGAIASEKQVIDVESAKSHIDYMITNVGENIIEASVDDNHFAIKTYPEEWPTLSILDEEGAPILLTEIEGSGSYQFDDERFPMCKIQPAKGDTDTEYFILTIDEKEWVFAVTEKGTFYRNDFGHLISLDKIEAIGWESNMSFGSGRGYIWSRTLPLMKETLIKGYGADTYCIYFPQNDYIGKYNAGWNINMVVDKPHNMYMGMWIGTGGLSFLAFISMLLIYIYQSVRLYFSRKDESKLFYVGVGIFLGIVGFSVSGFVNDSSVSVMPLFYGLLGLGVSTNIMIQNSDVKGKSSFR